MEDRWNTDMERRDMTVWLFDEGSFVPMAMIKEGRSYSILTDQLGTPTEAYDADGNEVWSRVLDMDGNVIEETGNKGMVPFLFQGQYYDRETGLAYNRFRYYSPLMGMYVSQDPIGLAGGILNLYGYVDNTNTWIDILGLGKESQARRIREQGKHTRNSEYPHGNSPKIREEVIKRHTGADGKIRGEDGVIIPKSEVTVEHRMPVVTHWNQEGYNQSREQRAAWYNSSENLTVLRKSSNSSAGAQLGETYRQDVGSQYTSKRKKKQTYD